MMLKRPFIKLVIPLVLIFPAIVPAQISVSYQFGDILPSFDARVYSGGTCQSYNVAGSEGSSSVDLNISFPSGEDLLVDFLVDGELPMIGDLFTPTVTPTFRCERHILNINGYINSYLVTGDPNSLLEKVVSGGVSMRDEIEVFSPVATTIELPFRASASIAVMQAFCNEDGSKATARATVTASLGESSATVSGEVCVVGALLENDNPSESATVSVPVSAGLNRFSLSISGELYVKSAVKGISPLGILACGSNAVASAGNSLDVYYFTGPNGTPLPEGLRITGLTTGINYVDPEAGVPCLNVREPEFDLEPASCGRVNGRAMIIAGSIPDTAQVLWSNGVEGTDGGAYPGGEHSVIINYGGGCAKSFEFTVMDPTLPELSLLRDTVIRDGESITLDGTSLSNRGLSFLWDNGVTTPTRTVVAPGTYSLTVFTPDGCEYNYLVEVGDGDIYPISRGDIRANSGLFVDDGGLENDYGNEVSYVVTVCPESDGRFTSLDFRLVNIDGEADQDELSIFDGKSTICPLSSSLTTPEIFTSSSLDGCLTVRFRATALTGSASGWEAVIGSSDTPGSQRCFEEIIGCRSIFTDTGGEFENYAIGDYRVYYLCPDSEDAVASLTFSTIQLASDARLFIYDGAGSDCILTGYPQINESYVASTESGGCLTVIFSAGSSTNTSAGWEAQVSCLEREINTQSSCDCGVNPIPANICSQAPLLNNLEAFCGESSILYTVNVSGDLEEEFSCGRIHNNSFLRFVPNENSVTFTFASIGGNTILCEGFQLAVLSVDGVCDAPNANWELHECLTISDGIDANGLFVVDGLEIGEEYYLMIDGSFGSECGYSLSAESGIMTCPLNLEAETVKCEESFYFVEIPIRGQGTGREFQIFEKNNFFGGFDTLSYVDDGSLALLRYGPYRSGVGYVINIIGGEGIDRCEFQITGSGTDCAEPCTLESTFTVRCIDYETEKFEVTGRIISGISPYSVYHPQGQFVIFPGDEMEFKDTIVESTVENIQYTIQDFNGCMILIGPEEIQECVPPSCDIPRVYPNPINSEIILSNVCIDYVFRLYTYSGKLISSGNLAPGDNMIQATSLARGMYLLKLCTTHEEECFTLKIVK